MTGLTAKAQSEKLVETMLRGAKINKLFEESMKQQFLISGKTMGYWEQKFKLHIPKDNLTPMKCVELDRVLMDLHQDATFYYNVSDAKTQLAKSGQTSEYNSRVNKIIAEFKLEGNKIPAADTLKAMAAVHTEGIASASTIAEVELKFWKNIIAHLQYCRKMLENASLNISVEIKAMSQSGLIESMARKAIKGE